MRRLDLRIFSLHMYYIGRHGVFSDMMVFLEEEFKTALSRIEGQAMMYIAVGASEAHRQNPQEFLSGTGGGDPAEGQSEPWSNGASAGVPGLMFRDVVAAAGHQGLDDEYDE
jgi:hypothetical protein